MTVLTVLQSSSFGLTVLTESFSVRSHKEYITYTFEAVIATFQCPLCIMTGGGSEGPGPPQ